MKIHLRKLKSSDNFDLFAIYSNPEVSFPGGFKPIKSLLEMDELINQLYPNNEVIVYKDKVIGIIGIDHIEDGVGMLGFLIHEDYWNQGFGTEACKHYLPKAKEMGYDTLYADCLLNNIASQKLLKKIGFKYINDYIRPLSGYEQPQQLHLYKKELL